MTVHARPSIVRKSEIEKNPFALLEVSTRDDRQKIVQRAEEKSLSLDSEACSRARAELINPRQRIAAEVAWLPGLSPKDATDATLVLHVNPSLLLARGNDRPLARANLVASVFSILGTDLPVEEWVDWICRLADLSEAIESADVLREINEDRMISHFPEINSLDVIEEEL